MLAWLITFAATEEGHESSKTLFYVCGSALAAWALLVSAIGIRRHAGWPSTEGQQRAVMGITAVLVLGAVASAVITA